MLRGAVIARLRWPFAPLYFMAEAASEKGYLALARSFPELWPRPGCPMPDAARGMAAELLGRHRDPAWDPVRGVFHREKPMRAASAGAPSKLTRLAEFYRSVNPGQPDGDSLLCLAPVSFVDLLLMPARGARAASRRVSPCTGFGVASLSHRVCGGCPFECAVRRSTVSATEREHMRAGRIAVIVVCGALAACGSGPGDPTGAGGGSTVTGYGASWGYTTGYGASHGGTLTGTTTGGGDPRVATCQKVAAKTTACCPPGGTICTPDMEGGWFDWCMSFYDSCPESFECVAATESCDADCPTFGSGC